MFGQPAASTAGFGTTGFGQTTSTFGTAGAQQQPATGLFGQPAATSQPQSIGLFGAQQQPKPAGFGFGATATSSAAPAFGFGTTTNTGTTAFGATAAKPTGFGAFGTTATSQPSAFGQPAGKLTKKSLHSKLTCLTEKIHLPSGFSSKEKLINSTQNQKFALYVENTFLAVHAL